jgi:putative transposase
VIQRGNNRGSIFRDATDHEVFLSFLKTASAKHGVSVHGYALMPNHYHLVATPEDARGLPRTMKELGGRYVNYFNRKHQRIGTLWNGRYRAIVITDETYWLTCLRYVEQNPVRAQIVRAPEMHPWSSYRIHALGADPAWLVLHRVYLALGADEQERQAAYRALCGAPVSDAEIVDQRLAWGQTGVRRVSDPPPDPRLTPKVTPKVVASLDVAFGARDDHSPVR